MRIVRKNRGSDASSTAELRAKLLERKKQMEQKISLPVKSISSNWKTKRDSHSPGQGNASQHSQSFVQEGEAARHSLSSGHKDEQNNFLSDDFAQNTEILGKDSNIKKVRKQLSISPVKKVQSLHESYFSDFEKDVLKLLKELNGKIETVSSNMAKLIIHILPNEKVLSKPKGMPTLPLKTSREVSQIETFLQDEDNLSCTSIYLSSYVSKNTLLERTSAMKLMAQIFTNVVGSEYSFSGQAGKRKFENLLLWTALKGAISLKIDDTDFSACKKGVQVWLKDAKWRDQGGSTSTSSQQPCPSQKKSTRKEKGLRQNYSSSSEE
ncbi:uncharacterized protein LOC143896755, partial [Temnothorax americanus]|uniref:uncharacterized protein LOC143896755 n=1 Tax=Temnothorax americanus TaxID=1964332 RepID=UPI0040683096